MMNKNLLLLFSLLILLAPTTMRAQAFPEIWDESSYDYQQGVKGYMQVINYGGASTPWENKAFIFATNVITSGIGAKKDLFRLTCQGVSTMNSPYAGYNVKLNFANQGAHQGGINGQNNHLYLHGKNALFLGTQEEPSMVSITGSLTTIGSDIKTDHDGVVMQFGNTANNNQGWFGSRTKTNISFGANSQSSVIVDTLRNMYVGLYIADFQSIKSSLRSQYSLFVKKGVLAEDFAIAPIASWADYVFRPDYYLKPLAEVDAYIKKEKHLPDMPSAEDVAKEGYSQHEMNKLLLQKIEELTLYTISQQQRIEELEEELKALKN